jgi:predicted nucleic acid-binding protein
VPSPVSGPDAADMPFVEVCLGGPAECVVTGNFKHFTPAIRKVVNVLSPKEFVAAFTHSE